MSYLDERFEAAVFTLVGEGSVKDRLVTAYLKHLDDLESDELPQGLQKSFEDVDTALHAVTPIDGEPCVRAAIRKMSKMQASSHARTIVSLYAELVCHGERAEPLKAVKSKPLKAVKGKPLKAVKSKPLKAVKSKPLKAVKSKHKFTLL